MNKLGLLDNRSKLTPRQSMDAIINYARQQDHRITVRNIMGVRVHTLVLSTILLPALSYLTYQLFVGYWPSIYPRTVSQNLLEVAPSNKKLYFTPELYLKDLERYKKDLKIKDTEQIRKSLAS